MLFDRAGEPYAEFGVDQTHFSPGSSGLSMLDHRDGTHRQATSAEFVDFINVGHQLRHVRLLATAFSARDIEPAVSDAWRLYLLLRYTSRAFVSGAFTEHGVPRLVKLMRLYRGMRPTWQPGRWLSAPSRRRASSATTRTPARTSSTSSRPASPSRIVPVTLMGLNAPVTTLGAAAFHTVEVLAGVTMAQLIRPGAPTLFGGAAAAFHMRHTTTPIQAIEALRRLTAATAR